MPTLGDKALCVLCNHAIDFDGRIWRHSDSSPRHQALPTICGYTPDESAWAGCTRFKGHEGPCAHAPVGTNKAVDVTLAADNSALLKATMGEAGLKHFTQAEVSDLLKAQQNKVKIGCVTLIRVAIQGPPKFYAVNCKKGRGIILPGGKWDKGESFVECAIRELYEETGIIAKDYRLVFQGMSEEGYYTYAFVATFFRKDTPTHDEGELVHATWDDLCKSSFRGYYELLRHELSYSRSVGDK